MAQGALVIASMLASTALMAQARPAAPVTAPVSAPSRVNPEAAVPGNPEYAPDAKQVAVQPEQQLPPAVWTPVDAQDLVMYIQQVGRDGLNSADYDPAGLDSAIRSGDLSLMSAAATQRFNSLSSDLALGHVRRSARGAWYITDGDLDSAKQDSLLRTALAGHDIAAALNGLLPIHPQYAALKSSLEMTAAGQTAKADRIRLNMDRWRWL
nr:hypothetical protein [Sphingomonas sp.]